jgi:hypothetical protein
MQSNAKWGQMAEKLVKKGDGKISALTNHLSFAGALSPSLALLIGQAASNGPSPSSHSIISSHWRSCRPCQNLVPNALPMMLTRTP